MPGWNGSMNNGLNIEGSAHSGDSYKPVQLWFDSSLYIINYNDVDINHVWGDFRYELDKF